MKNTPELDWFRNESFFGPLYYRGDQSREGYLAARPLSNSERTEREVEGVIRLLGLAPERRLRLLDAPCGYGRHLPLFASRGLSVTGIDLNMSYVTAARSRLSDFGQDGNVVNGELSKLPFPSASFDVVVNLFFSFGFYSSDEDNRECLREFFRVLRPGGNLVLHSDVNLALVASGAYMANQPLERTLPDGSRLVVSEHMDWDSGRLVGSWSLVGSTGDSSTQSGAYSMRVLTRQEFERWCAGAGFGSIRFFGTFDPGPGQEFSDESKELILVATKEG